MPFEDILVAVEAPIAVDHLQPASVLNALRTLLLREVSTALAELESNRDVRCVVITGAGEKAFAAGADISGAQRARVGTVMARRNRAAVRPSPVRSSE